MYHLTQVNTDWQMVNGFVDPPEPPDGYILKTERDCFFGFVMSYRFVPKCDNKYWNGRLCRDPAR